MSQIQRLLTDLPDEEPAAAAASEDPGGGGDPFAEAFAALYDRSISRLYGLAMRITGDAAAAEAVVLAVFTEAWTRAQRDGLDDPGSAREAALRQDLAEATRRCAILRMRAAQADDGPADDAGSPGDPGDAGDPGDSGNSGDPDDTGDAGASGDTGENDAATLHLPHPAQPGLDDSGRPDDPVRTQAALAALPPTERQAIELAYFEGLTLPQIANRLDRPRDAALHLIRTGLERLRVLFEDHDAGADWPDADGADASGANTDGDGTDEDGKNESGTDEDGTNGARADGADTDRAGAVETGTDGSGTDGSAADEGGADGSGADRSGG